MKFLPDRKILKTIGSLLIFSFLVGQLYAQRTSNHGNKFEQLDGDLPTANKFRGADGAPGPEYWQQQADYKIDCTLDTEKHRLDGTETITYYNNSPSILKYIWLQLDENEHRADADNHKFNPSSIQTVMSERALDRLTPSAGREKFGCNIESVVKSNGEELNYTINKTMMRIDLPRPLKPTDQITFKINWHYYITEHRKHGGRGDYEYFEDNDNYTYTITQWFPRLCVYNDAEGWQNKQFTGRGEFALNFGNYDVKITLPDDYMVASTGECQNYGSVLTPLQMSRYRKAQTASEPVMIHTLEEAKKIANGKKSTKTKTWHFKAENVRDFAWGASRKFVWDAMPHITSEGKRVMCMSYYPKESYPIYNRYSTKAVEHTLRIYSKYTFPYPYPVAISVEADRGMEYPMIAFNPGRAESDGTYTERAKKAAISVIIHEVGHFYFPMIVNSDERKWTWMDEGINSFVQFLAESEFDNNYNSRRGPAHKMAGYMSSPKETLEPIMTNSDNIVQFGNNAYGKPATGLNILRETIMGRELFDFAFKEYSERWAFKHPTPADFFRTMEDASGVDLDWFWRGWFYSIDATDIALDSIKWYKVDLENNPEPQEREYPIQAKKPFDDISKIRNKEAGMEFQIEKDTNLVDFYTHYKPWETEDSVTTAKMVLYDEPYGDKEKQKRFGHLNYYELYFTNKGGLVMPVIIEWTYKDGTKEMEKIPAEIWRKNENSFTKVFVKNKEVEGIVIDPYRETADIDLSNNNWPVKEMPSRFQVFKKHKSEKMLNPMQKAAKKKETRP